MKWLGYKQIALKAIVVDAPDIRARTKAAHVAELAADIRARGEEPIHAPTVRKGDNLILCGRDRFAALLTLKVKKAWVHLVECDDAEAAELELAENIYRRADNRTELLAHLVALKEQHIRAKAADDEDNVPIIGRQNHALDPVKAEARRQVARAAGITTAAVRKAEQRSAAKDVARSGHGVAGDPSPVGGEAVAPTAGPGRHETPGPDGNLPPLCIDLLGTPREHAEAGGLFDDCAAIQAAIDEADKHMRLALAATKPLEGTSFANASFQTVRREIQRVGSLLRSERPGAICPWCKGLARQIPECGGCDGRRWVSAERAATAPEEVRDAEQPFVIVQGRTYPYALLARETDGRKFHNPPATAAVAQKRPRGLTVELDDGTKHPLEDFVDEEAP